MEKQIEGAFRRVVAFLEEEGYRYAIIGGVAVAQWGFPRATNDVDIKVLVPNTDYAGVRAALLKRFPERARVDVPENPFIVAVTVDKVIVDFLLTLPGYEEQIIERAERRDFGGISAWLCSVEDLIIQKVVAGREKDWLDLEALLLEQYGKLDDAFIDGWLEQFAEALDKPEIVAKYRQLVEKTKTLRQNLNPRTG